MKNIKRLVVFSVAMMLSAAAAPAQTSITKVVIRDCSKAADTTTTVSNGATLDPGKLPSSWTLDFVLNRSADVIFTTDSGSKMEYESVPYCPVGHNVGLRLGTGTHKVTVQINHGSISTFTFGLTTGTTAPATPTSETGCQFGSNGEGVPYPSDDPTVHPQLIAAARKYNFQYYRQWAENSMSTPFPSNYWTIPKRWAADGVKVMVVMNFQNSNRVAPSDSTWIAKMNSFPASSASGVWGVSLGNECDISNYYIGSVSQLAHLMALAYPILHSKGYQVLSPSSIKGLGYLQSLQNAGAFKYCDYLDYHIYDTTAAVVLGKVDGFKNYCNSVGKSNVLSEIGIRGTGSNLTGWGNEYRTLFTGLKQRSGIFVQFPMYWQISTDPLTQQAPLGKTYGTNNPFTGIWDSLSN